jgi:hypothetical protein
MKRLIIFTLMSILLIVSLVDIKLTNAAVHVKGYFRSDGTFVSPHYRSSPDNSFYNNYSTYGNINPYTGEIGTKMTPNYNFQSDTSLYKYGRDIEEIFEGDTSNSYDTDIEGDVEYSVTEDDIIPQESQDEKEATEVFMNDYIKNINNKHYEDSYSVLAKELREKYSFEVYAENRSSFMYDVYDISATTAESGVTLQGNLLLTDSSDSSVKSYKFRYEMIKEGGEWKLGSKYINE